MIIKFQERDSWVMFGEIDHLEYHEINDDIGYIVPDDVIECEPPNSPIKGKRVEMSFFTKNMNEATIIRVYSPIYIMNDNGRTVETI